MATQALVSSSSLTFAAEAVRQSFRARSLPSSVGCSRKGSFLVRAAATPPVKVSLSLTQFKYSSLCFDLCFYSN